MAGYIIQDREQMLTLPARQVDALLDLSDGDAALLYLCLMRVEGAVTPEQLMEKLHLSALRLQAAQTKLEKLGLIRAQALPVPEPPRRPAEFTDRELGDLLRDGEFQMLVEETERALGKKLTTMDLKRLASLHREVGLPADVIFLLVRHCVENQELRYGPGRRPTVAFIEREGHYWAKRGLFDQESAARFLRSVSQRRERTGEYMAALQMGDWGFSPEMVAIAYEKTVLKKQGMNWKYLNGILRRWNQEGLHTPQALEQEKRPEPKSQQGKTQAIEEYMKW